MGRCGTHRKRANHRPSRRCAVQCPRVPRQEGTRLAPPGSLQPWPFTLASDLRASTHCLTVKPNRGREGHPRPELRELNQISNSNLESTAALMDHRHYHHRCRARPPNRALIERRAILSISNLISTPHSLCNAIVLRCVLCALPVSLCGSTLFLHSSTRELYNKQACKPHAACLPPAAHGACRRTSRSLLLQLLKQGRNVPPPCPCLGRAHLASDCPSSSLTRPSKTPPRV